MRHQKTVNQTEGVQDGKMEIVGEEGPQGKKPPMQNFKGENYGT